MHREASELYTSIVPGSSFDSGIWAFDLLMPIYPLFLVLKYITAMMAVIVARNITTATNMTTGIMIATRIAVDGVDTIK